MKAQIIPFPPARIKRMVEPTYVQGNKNGGTGLDWFLRVYMDIPTVQNGYHLETQHDPLWEHYKAKLDVRNKRKPRKSKPKIDPSRESDIT